MTEEQPSYLEYSRKINGLIGTLSWQEEVCALTKEFLDHSINGKEERSAIADILKFCEQAIVFDQTQVKEYFIKNANASQILELGLQVRALNCSDLLTEYLTFIHDHKELDQNTKDTIEGFIVRYAIQLWPHLDIVLLTDWAIEGKNKKILLNAILYFPYHHMAMEDEMEEVLIHLLADKDWLTYAKVFTKFPGMINEYNEEFQIKAVLADASEDNQEVIKRFVTEVYDGAPMDTNLHMCLMSLFDNVFVNQCFMEMAEASIQAMEEMNLWNSQEIKMPEQPTNPEG